MQMVNTTVKELRRAYKRNNGAIAAMVAEYYKATGKTDFMQTGGMKSNAQKASASKQGQHLSQRRYLKQPE